MSDWGPVSSNDVARLAGVTRASVSRAFSQDSLITPQTRQRVLEAAKQLGYQPNAIARSLIMGKSGIVGIVIADLDNPFYAAVLNALCQDLQSRGVGALVLAANGMEGVDALIPRLLSYQVEGVLIASSVQNSRIALQCVQAKRRVVLINRYVDLPEVSAVCCDNYLGGKLAAAHLLEMKYKRFAFLAGSESTFGSKKREEGFTTRLEVSGKRLAAREIGNYNYSDASEVALRLLKLSPRPDAIFCANDIMALAVLDVARREFGLSVPHELGVVGFDNTAMSAASAYDLTSIDQDIRAMTGTAVRILLAEPQTQDSKLILTSCRLQVRSSSRRV